MDMHYKTGRPERRTEMDRERNGQRGLKDRDTPYLNRSKRISEGNQQRKKEKQHATFSNVSTASTLSHTESFRIKRGCLLGPETLGNEVGSLRGRVLSSAMG